MRRREFVRSLAGLPFAGVMLPARAAADAVPSLAVEAGVPVFSPQFGFDGEGSIYLGRAVPGTHTAQARLSEWSDDRWWWSVRFRAATSSRNHIAGWPFALGWRAGDDIHVSGLTIPRPLNVWVSVVTGVRATREANP